MEKTVRMTVAQAIVKFLDNQYVAMDGVETKFVEGFFTIFGHGYDRFKVLPGIFNACKPFHFFVPDTFCFFNLAFKADTYPLSFNFTVNAATVTFASPTAFTASMSDTGDTHSCCGTDYTGRILNSILQRKHAGQESARSL